MHMLKQRIKGKTAVFIDAANIFYSERSLGWRVDYKRLIAYLRQETQLISVNFYTGIIASHEKQQSFLRRLKSFGYKTVAKPVKIIRSAGGEVISKGNLDIELALDAYMERKDYDTLILFSGDSDFSYLLDVLRRDGKHIVVISTRGHVSKELIARSVYVPLSKLR